MASMQKFLEEWPQTPQGQAFVANITLEIPDPAIFFYENEEDNLRVLGMPRKKLHGIIIDLMGQESKMAQMTSLQSDVFYWMLYASEKDGCLLLGVPCTPAKKALS